MANKYDDDDNYYYILQYRIVEMSFHYTIQQLSLQLKSIVCL